VIGAIVSLLTAGAGEEVEAPATVGAELAGVAGESGLGLVS
jgi:hypothetical protein